MLHQIKSQGLKKQTKQHSKAYLESLPPPILLQPATLISFGWFVSTTQAFQSVIVSLSWGLGGSSAPWAQALCVWGQRLNLQLLRGREQPAQSMWISASEAFQGKHIAALCAVTREWFWSIYFLFKKVGPFWFSFSGIKTALNPLYPSPTPPWKEHWSHGPLATVSVN